MLHSRRTPLFAQPACVGAGAPAGSDPPHSLGTTVVADGLPAGAKYLLFGAAIRHRF